MFFDKIVICKFSTDKVLDDAAIVKGVVNGERVVLVFRRCVDFAEISEVVLFGIAACAPFPLDKVGIIIGIAAGVYSVLDADVNAHSIMGTGYILKNCPLLAGNGKSAVCGRCVPKYLLGSR